METFRPLPAVSAVSVASLLLENRFRGGLRHFSISAWERKLEDQRKLWVHLNEDLQDDGIRCDVCANSDTTPDDAIVLCDGCDVAVHQSCYAIREVPEGEWFCEYCAAKRSSAVQLKKLRTLIKRNDLTRQQKQAEAAAMVEAAESTGIDVPCLPRRCVLCPRTSGALIRTTEGLWAHVSCGLWVPECWIVGCREVCGVTLVAPSRFDLPCCICGMRGHAAVQCAHEKCDATFHAVCAVMAGFGMNITDQINIQRKNNDVTFHAFCLRHRICSHTRSVPTDTPLEFRRNAPDFNSPLYQSAMLIRRNRDIRLYAAQLESEKSIWGARLAAYLLKEFDDNVRTIRILWGSLQSSLTTGRLTTRRGASGESEARDEGKGPKTGKRKIERVPVESSRKKPALK